MKRIFSRYFAPTVAFASICLPSVTADAAWSKASTRHFIIYSEQSPEKLREYAEGLERFDQAVRLLRGWDDPDLGDGNRITIYEVRNVAAVQRIYGRRGFVYGFFIPRYNGPIAFTPRTADKDPDGLNANAVFFHEYGHHLMFQQFSMPMPNWFVEGFAELVGTRRVEKDGSVTIGVAPQHRAYGVFDQGGLTTREVIANQPEKMTDLQRDSLYGRGWLLTHYFLIERGRPGQLNAYFSGLNDGLSMQASAVKAFGDLDALDKDIERYLARKTINSITIKASALKVGKIEISPLSAGAQEAIQWRMQSDRGVDAEKAEKVVAGLRQVAERHPGDAFVQVGLAEAEFDAKQYARSLAAAKAALAVDPKNVQAQVFKGRALMQLADSGDKTSTYEAARDAFLAANKIDPEDPEPLYLFYESFVRNGQVPTANAIQALHYASVLAPADTGVRMNSAVAYLNNKKWKEARAELLPVAFNPHGGDLAEKVRGAVTLLDAGNGEAALQSLVEMQKSPPEGDGDSGKNSRR